MDSFEDVGRHYVISQIEELEAAKPGWLPMFYFTCTYDGDIEAARLLREKYDIPRPAEVSQRISADKTKFTELLAIAQAERDHHNFRMKNDWLYWFGVKIGIIKMEGS